MPSNITITSGDLLESDADALVNAVNTVGVMSRGIALQFRHSFPENYKAYRVACKRGEVRTGEMFVTSIWSAQGQRFIINFPTKRDWRQPSELAYIDAGLIDLVDQVRTRNIRSIAVPPLGCGLGGLDWKDVRPRIEEAFAGLPEVQVLLYGPKWEAR
jgi:O-acetyl-ADP-ribose deacetylase (regulator of RNase III)